MSDDTVSSANSEGSFESSCEDDYVFRFRLDPSAVDEEGYSDPLLELIRGQLADLLDAAVLTCKGEEVKVDGFRLMQEPDTCYEIYPPRSEDNQPSGTQPA